MSDTTETPSGGRWKRSGRWLQLAVCGLAVFLMPALGLVCALLLAPGLLALLVEEEPSRPIARNLLAYGAMAAIEPVRFLWWQPENVEMAFSTVTDLRGIALAWVAAAIGWVLSSLAPVGVHFLLERTTRSRAEELRSAREVLVAEWGIMETPADQNETEAARADQ